MVSISIIVPVYGVEKYLKQCVESLINQTQKDIEIILVDDASPDNSASIMRDYENRFPDKIRCFYSKVNLKQGGARNIGLKEAKGEYVLFVDSDDWIDPTMCEKMYFLAKKADSDIVLCDYLKIFEDTGVRKHMMEIGREISGVLTRDKYKALLMLNAYPVCKLIRRTIIVDHGLQFAEKIKYEDQTVVPFFFLYAKKAEKINEALYFYNIREDSTMRTKNSMNHFDRMTATLLFYDQARARGFYDMFREEIDLFFMRSYCFIMLECCLERFDQLPLTKMKEISITMKQICPYYYDNYYVDKIIDPKYLRMAKLNDEDPEKLKDWSEEQRKQIDSYENFYIQTKKRADDLLNYCKKNQYKIALWGAGRKGTDFLKINDRNNQLIQYVIDLDPNKKNKVLSTGHLITNFEDSKYKIGVIFVSNKYHYGDIYDIAKAYNKEIHVINLDIYLTYDIDIKEYFLD